MTENTALVDWVQEANNYLSNLQYRNYAENTLINYAGTIKGFLEYVVLDLKGATPGASDMMTYVVAMKNKRLKASTINARLSAISHFFEYLLIYNKINYNPVVKDLYLRKVEPMRIYCTYDEYKELIRIAPTWTAKFGLILMYKGGLRKSELDNLSARHLFLDNPTHINIENSKYNKSRIAPLFLEDWEREIIENEYKYMLDGQLTVNMRGTVDYVFKKFNKTSNRQITAHCLRRAYATNLAKMGVKIEVIAKILGHTSINTTLQYIVVLEQDILSLVS